MKLFTLTTLFYFILVTNIVSSQSIIDGLLDGIFGGKDQNGGRTRENPGESGFDRDRNRDGSTRGSSTDFGSAGRDGLGLGKDRGLSGFGQNRGSIESGQEGFGSNSGIESGQNRVGSGFSQDDEVGRGQDRFDQDRGSANSGFNNGKFGYGADGFELG